MVLLFRGLSLDMGKVLAVDNCCRQIESTVGVGIPGAAIVFLSMYWLWLSAEGKCAVVPSLEDRPFDFCGALFIFLSQRCALA